MIMIDHSTYILFICHVRFAIDFSTQSIMRNYLSRRLFLGQLAALPVAATHLSALSLLGGEDLGKQRAAAVGWTPTSFVVNGQPRFVAAGSMDYFRCPAEYWRDRLLQAKRAGINTLMTYVAWNMHEQEEGKFNFTGGSDLKHYLELCADLQMMAIVRVGPFICDEWEAAGYPAWLIGKHGSQFRIKSPVTDPYIRRWFEQLCRQIAPMQASRGGPVILVQAENEYYYAGRPGGLEYLAFLRQTLQDFGINVPITGCGDGDEVQLPGELETINGYTAGTKGHFRSKHPDWPLLISEHYTDWMDCWGWAPTGFPNRTALEQQSIEALAQQVMLSYFCFHGGTNFGYFASSTWKTDHSWVTTRYWAHAPVLEGGGLSDRYFAVKSASLPIANFEDFFCAAKSIGSPLSIEGPVRTLALQSEQGTMIFVLPAYPVTGDKLLQVDGDRVIASVLAWRPTPDLEVEPGTIQLPSGRKVPLAAGSQRALIVPHQFRVDQKNAIDYTNATLAGIGGNADRRVLVVWGETGNSGVLSVNGAETEFVFPGDIPLNIAVGGTTVLAVSSEMADRTWFADERIIIGPSYVGEHRQGKHECWLDETTTFVLTVAADGAIEMKKAAPKPLPAKVLPLSWSRHDLSEPSSKEQSGWKALDKPLNVEQLDAYYGYSWYRASAHSSVEQDTGLLFTEAADRVHVWGKWEI